MKAYLDLLKQVLEGGSKKEDRTGTGTVSIFGTQTRYSLSEGFPLVTTKKIHWKSIVHELLWFLKGDTNIEYLVKNGVRIWNEWPYEVYKKSSEYTNEDLDSFVHKIKTDSEFANKWGKLGPVYGKQWRDFNGVDQISNVINDLRNNPTSRRIIVSAWNPSDIPSMILPPCHSFFQFYVIDGCLSCQLYQRSADLFLGVPFNVASYSLLIHLVAHVCELEVGDFIHTIGDAHIYSNHFEQVKIQLERTPRSLPRISLNKNIKSIFEFSFEDIELLDYNPLPLIKAKVAV